MKMMTENQEVFIRRLLEVKEGAHKELEKIQSDYNLKAEEPLTVEQASIIITRLRKLPDIKES